MPLRNLRFAREAALANAKLFVTDANFERLEVDDIDMAKLLRVRSTPMSEIISA